MMIKKLLLELKSRFEKDRCKKKWLLMKNPLWGGVLKSLAGSLSDKNSIQSTNPLREKEK